MELFLMCIVAAYMLQNAVVDTTAAVKGRTPPSHERWMQRRASTARRAAPARVSPAGRYLSQSFGDALDRWSTRSRQRHQRRLAWMAEKAPTKDEQWLARRRNRAAKAAATRERFARARGVAWDKTRHRVGLGGQRDTPDGMQCSDKQNRPAGPETLNPDPAEACTPGSGSDAAETSDDQPAESEGGAGRDQSTSNEAKVDGTSSVVGQGGAPINLDTVSSDETTTQEAPVSAGSAPAEASEAPTVPNVPLAARPAGEETQHCTGGTVMSQAPAEGGLAAAIAYAEQMSASTQEAVTSLETTAASLEAHGWTGDAVTGFRDAMDGYAAIQAHLDRAGAALQQSQQVKDAYQGAMHTGSKESVLAE